MQLVLTMMVRDEADIIAATIEHHLAQGVDRIIVTDNASTDGTLEILRAYEAVAPVTVLEDPEHRKQQAAVVTRMARMAHTEFGADWVINGDADEFVVARDAALTVRDALARTPSDVGQMLVPVHNLVGPMAERGSGVRRLVHRDERSPEQLAQAGLLSHPTPNAIHIGSPEVEVIQGNHGTSIPSGAAVPEGLELEVLHLPWRSAAQLRRKTEHMGRGYDANPDLRPSPNHHGMRDWRRMQAGLLDGFLALRMPTTAELAQAGFTPDTRIRDGLDALAGRAVLPDRLAATLDDSDDGVVEDDRVRELRHDAEMIARAEGPVYRDLSGLRIHADALERERELLARRLLQEEGTRLDAERNLTVAREQAHAHRGELDALREAHAALQDERDELRARVDRFETHPAFRLARSVRERLPGRGRG